MRVKFTYHGVVHVMVFSDVERKKQVSGDYLVKLWSNNVLISVTTATPDASCSDIIHTLLRNGYYDLDANYENLYKVKWGIMP